MGIVWWLVSSLSLNENHKSGFNPIVKMRMYIKSVGSV